MPCAQHRRAPGQPRDQQQLPVWGDDGQAGNVDKGGCCSAAIRYRLLKAANSVQIDYADTDCIQGQNLEEYVKKDNEEQLFKNNLACNNSDIGCWKEEHKNCTQAIIGKKQRIIYDPQKGGFESSTAGCNKKYVLAHIKKMMEKYNSNVYLCLYEFLGGELKNVKVETYVPVKNGYKTEIISYGRTEKYKKFVLGEDDERESTRNN